MSEEQRQQASVPEQTHAPAAPLVSVIVPVFNAERHLEACLDSLFAQTLSSIEVIAVDDGSTDGSPVILASAAAGGRLRVLSLDGNHGVSAARNAGLDAARAGYVAFVDADDTVAPAMYEQLYRAADDARADIVYCGMRLVAADGTVTGTEPPPLPSKHVHTHAEVRGLLHQAWCRRLLWYPFRGIYRRALLDSNRVRFEIGIRKGEDSLFNLQALEVAERVTAIDTALYHYRKHEASATARPLESESANIERLGSAVTEFYRDHGFEESALDDFYGQVLRSDLPTAIIRLQGHPRARKEIAALLRTTTVHDAFRSQRISHLGVPSRVRLVLTLARWRQVTALVILPRVTGWRPRLSGA